MKNGPFRFFKVYTISMPIGKQIFCSAAVQIIASGKKDAESRSGSNELNVLAVFL